MSRGRRLRWETPGQALPMRPYRDTAILHLALAGLIVLVAWATGGGLGRAFVFAGAFFVIATAWSFWKWRARLRELADKGAGKPQR